MANYFFDSSGLVKRYIDEKGSAWIQEITASQSGNALYIARITGAELIAAITRRQRRCETTVSDAKAAVDAFRTDFTRAYFSLDVTPTVVSQAMNLAERYGLRGYDSVQLAAALELRDLCFASGLPLPVLIAADIELNAAAKVEGLAIDNPNSH